MPRPSVTLAPATLEELFVHRWIRLSTFARFVPFSDATLSRWAREGRLPAKRRFSQKMWWVDLDAIRESEAFAVLFDEDADAARRPFLRPSPPVVPRTSGPTLAPQTLDELLAMRWVRLTTFARFVPYSERTLARWARQRRLPAEHRGGDREWWVDLRAVRAKGGDVMNLFNEDADDVAA